MITNDIRQYLITHPDVSALIGDRVYVQEAPQLEPHGPTIPFVIYDEGDSLTEYFTDGEVGLHWREFTFECWAPTYDQARHLADTVRLSLSGIHKQVGGSYVHGVYKSGGGSLVLPGRHGEPSAVNGVELVMDVIFESNEVTENANDR